MHTTDARRHPETKKILADWLPNERRLYAQKQEWLCIIEKRKKQKTKHNKLASITMHLRAGLPTPAAINVAEHQRREREHVPLRY